MTVHQHPTVYVIGAGFSAGLGFPTIHDLLPRLWQETAPSLKLGSSLTEELAKVIRFHHTHFDESKPQTFPNIEQLLSEMEANAQLFEASRLETGNFTRERLENAREEFLFALTNWFHLLQAEALSPNPEWLSKLVNTLEREDAQIISFNWDLVLDKLLFGEELSRSSYGLVQQTRGPRLIKPHGSLNWFENKYGRYLTKAKKFSLLGEGSETIWAFTAFRAPKSKKGRRYMPLIVPPIYQKTFHLDLFRQLWQETVHILSTAKEIKFLGYSLPEADYHARFIFRCAFYNQLHGEPRKDRPRADPTGPAKITIVDPNDAGPKRIQEAVGRPCAWYQATIEDWVENGL